MKKIILLFLLLLFSITKSYAELKVTPTIIELNTKNVKSNYVTSSFNVQASKGEIIRFKIYPEYFSITPDGKMAMSKETENNDSLVKNIKFVPSEFTLQNGRTQRVRLTINDFKKLPQGESRLVLFLEDVKPKEVNLGNNYHNISTKLLVKTRIGIPVYLDSGRYIKKGEIETIDIRQDNQNLVYNMKILSTGNSKIRYQGKFQLIKDKQLIKEYEIDKNVIGRNNYHLSSGSIPIQDIKTNGEYTFRAILNYKDENDKNKNMLKEVKFNIDSIKQPI